LCVLIFRFLDGLEKVKAYSESNGSKHIPMLICS
jgi:hypothetical protein